MRLHKRLRESGRLVDDNVRLHGALSAVKQETDRAVLGNSDLLNNPAFFEKQTMPIVIDRFRDPPPALDAETFKLINGLLVKEYLEQAQGHLPF
jgi:hypothetical protein